MKLYELAGNYKNISDLLDDPSMEQETITTALATIEQGITEKVGNIAALCKSLDSDIEAIKAEESRLAERRKVTENKLRWLKDYIQMSMEAAGLDKIKTPIFSFAIQNNPPKITVDMNLLPKKYTTKTISYAADKKAILAALKEGKAIKGATLEQGKHLRIR